MTPEPFRPHACATGELNLESFPPVFRAGGGAAQMRLLHSALASAASPLTAVEIAPKLPAETKFDTARILLLLEVLHSRDVVVCSEGTAEGERQWRLAA